MTALPEVPGAAPLLSDRLPVVISVLMYPCEGPQAPRSIPQNSHHNCSNDPPSGSRERTSLRRSYRGHLQAHECHVPVPCSRLESHYALTRKSLALIVDVKLPSGSALLEDGWGGVSSVCRIFRPLGPLSQASKTRMFSIGPTVVSPPRLCPLLRSDRHPRLHRPLTRPRLARLRSGCSNFRVLDACYEKRTKRRHRLFISDHESCRLTYYPHTHPPDPRLFGPTAPTKVLTRALLLRRGSRVYRGFLTFIVSYPGHALVWLI